LGEVLLRCAGVGEEQRAAPHPTLSPSPSAALGGGGDEEAGGEAAAMARCERRWRLVGEARRVAGWGIQMEGEGIGGKSSRCGQDVTGRGRVG